MMRVSSFNSPSRGVVLTAPQEANTSPTLQRLMAYTGLNLRRWRRMIK
jgi:hypothetical protein